MAVELPEPDLDWVYFAELKPRDPDDGGNPVSIYWATDDVFFDADDPDVPNREYNGIIDVALSFSAGIEIGGGFIRPNAQPSYGALTAKVDDELFYDATAGVPWFKSLDWDGCEIVILRGVRPRDGAPWRYADLSKIFDGICAGGETFGAMEIAIPIGGMAERLRQEIFGDTYGGTGGFDGTADLKGELIRRGIGLVQHAEPVLVDPADEWWDVAPLDGFHSAVKVYQGAYEYTYSMSSPPDPGEVYIDMANGRIQTNGMPVLRLTVSFRSNFGGGVLTKADCARAVVVDELGLDESRVDDDTIDSLNLADSSSVSLYVTEPVTAEDVVNRILGPGCFHTEDVGVFQVFQFQPPDVATPDDADLLITDDDIALGGLSFHPRRVPPYRLDFAFNPCWTRFNTGDVADDADPADRGFVLSPWRIEPYNNATTEGRKRQSRPARVESYTADGGATEATRLGAILTVDDETIDVPLLAAPFALKPHAQVWVQSDFNNIDLAYRAVNVSAQSNSGKVPLTLWRPVS